MFKLLDRSTETCIGLKVAGKLKADDYNHLQPVVNNAIQAHGTINMVLEVDEFEGYQDLDAILADVQMSLDKADAINKVAIVSESDWQEVATKVLDPLALNTNLEYFSMDQRDKAWTWACGQSWKN